MIILQVITTLVYGGAERLLVNFSNVLAARHQIHIVYLKGEPKLKPFIDRRIKVHHVPLGFVAASRLRTLIKAVKPDVIHTHLGHADLIGLWASRRLGIKTFCTMHNVHFKWNWMDRVIFFLYWTTFKLHGRDCKVSCISKAVAEHLRTRLDVKSDKISVNYNAIPEMISPIPKTEARRKLFISPDEFVVLTIGRLRLQKSIDTLLEAASTLKHSIAKLSVVIVGEGELEHELKRKSQRLQIEQVVKFCGGTNTPELYFAASDVFVLPSVFEGLPTVVLEAFRSSTPVVASKIDGTSELIQDGENGLLFPPKNSDALAAHLSQLYQSPDLRHRIGYKGNASYKSGFEIAKYAHEMEALYLK